MYAHGTGKKKVTGEREERETKSPCRAAGKVRKSYRTDVCCSSGGDGGGRLGLMMESFTYT